MSVNYDEHPVAVAAAARAAADVQRGIADLERAVAGTPEYRITDDATGKRLIVASGAVARGMLAHLRESSGS